MPHSKLPVFDTKDEALEAGYVPARKAQIPGYRVIDVSGPHAFGYDFVLVPEDWQTDPKVPDTADEQAATAAVAQSVNVHLRSEVNKAGQRGAVLPMFAPEDIQRRSVYAVETDERGTYAWHDTGSVAITEAEAVEAVRQAGYEPISEGGLVEITPKEAAHTDADVWTVTVRREQ